MAGNVWRRIADDEYGNPRWEVLLPDGRVAISDGEELFFADGTSSLIPSATYLDDPRPAMRMRGEVYQAPFDGLGE